MIYSPGKTANTLDPQTLHLCKLRLMWNFTLLCWNYTGENLIKVQAQVLN